MVHLLANKAERVSMPSYAEGRVMAELGFKGHIEKLQKPGISASI
jgi:hypothetical protein